MEAGTAVIYHQPDQTDAEGKPKVREVVAFILEEPGTDGKAAIQCFPVGLPAFQVRAEPGENAGQFEFA